jgi:nucleoside 2-deoxyribosyltransferase
MIYKKDIDELNKCNLLLIILDGRTIDEGAAFELGFMKALRKPCFGFQTDSRRLHNNMNNPMIDCSLNATFYNSNDLFKWAADYNNSKTCSIQFTEK